jgi:hypothetical protein
MTSTHSREQRPLYMVIFAVLFALVAIAGWAGEEWVRTVLAR